MSIINFEATIAKDQEINGIQWVEVRPTAPIQQYSQLEFVIANTSEAFIDLSKTRLYVKCRVSRNNGDKIKINPPGNDDVAPTNFTLHTMWAQCDVYLQNRHISSSGWNGYPYKAYTDAVLKFDSDGWLKSHMMYLDYQEAMEATKPLGIPINDGLTLRYNRAGINGFEMEGGLFADIFQMDNPILNGVPIRVRLTPSPDSFRLIADQPSKNYKLILEDAKLLVCEVHPSPLHYSRVLNKLQKTTAKYGYMKHEFFTHVAPAQSLGVRLDNMFQGRVPTQMVVSLVKNKAFQGDYKLNPLNMQHFNVNYIDLNINGKSVPNNAPLEPNFTSGQVASAFMSTYVGTGLYGTPRSNSITLEKFKSGYTIYVFAIDPCLQNTDQMPIRKGGNVKLEIKFAKELKEAAIVMVHALFPQMLEIDAARNISLS